MIALALTGPQASTSPVVPPEHESLLASHLLVTWYGNPHSPAMGVVIHQ